jgi:hypothetical protein
VTRGKRLVVVVGQKKAVAIAVKNVSGRRRWSMKEWLSIRGPSLASSDSCHPFTGDFRTLAFFTVTTAATLNAHGVTKIDTAASGR